MAGFRLRSLSFLPVLFCSHAQHHLVCSFLKSKPRKAVCLLVNRKDQIGGWESKLWILALLSWAEGRGERTISYNFYHQVVASLVQCRNHVSRTSESSQLTGDPVLMGLLPPSWGAAKWGLLDTPSLPPGGYLQLIASGRCSREASLWQGMSLEFVLSSLLLG